MNRSPSIFFTALVSLGLAASLLAAGCAAPSSEAGADEELSEESLSAAGAKLVGSYWSRTPAAEGFARLDLQASGAYSAQYAPDDTSVCVSSPCLRTESGTWNASSKAGGAFRLRLRPTGQASRFYDGTAGASPGSAPTLTLTRAGLVQTLIKLAANQCLGDADCGPTTQCTQGPNVCLMFCSFDDPFCCGPATCQPKPPPATACWGAWLDQVGGCRGPADGVLPDSCCAELSTPCGPLGKNSCGVGEVCCNKVAGICAKPGAACVQ